ncbi:MAG: HAD family phosphatase [bacterium]|nr:HAD family phosphatase [bacterium]
MALQIECILFDYGHVITRRQNGNHLAKLQELAGLSASEFPGMYRVYRDEYDRGVIDVAEYWGRILSHGSVSPDAVRVQELVREDVLSWGDLDQRVIAWAAQLKRAGYRTAILSNMPEEILVHLREHADWWTYFDEHIISCELKWTKPDRRIYRHTIQMLGIPAERILFLDDMPENIDAARAEGMQGFVFTSFEDLVAFVRANGVLPVPEERGEG